MISNMGPMLLDPQVCTWSEDQINQARNGAGARARLLQECFGIDTAVEGRESALFERDRGIAIIRMNGPLFDDDLIVPHSGMSGYGGLLVQHAAALDAADVRGIFLDIDSPGGVGAPRLEDLAGAIMDGRRVKPILSHVRHVAASAAYWIGSAAAAVNVPGLGLAGSIGVWMLHIDISEMLKQAGINPTLIFSGDHKVDGNMFEPLPDGVRADFQERSDVMRDRFAAAVARHRGLSEAAVLETEAQIYEGQAAVDVGLADAVQPRETALQSLIDSAA